MNLKIKIRPETAADIDAIRAVTLAAFKDLAVSKQTEHLVIEALRASQGLTLSLVAELAGQVVGHIAFSPVTLSDGTPGWYGLGPVSVLPFHQRQGVGKALIREGLAQLREKQAQGCCLVGHPEYYRALGFQNPPGLAYPGVPAEVFFVWPFNGPIPQGTVAFHAGFFAGANHETD